MTIRSDWQTNRKNIAAAACKSPITVMRTMELLERRIAHCCQFYAWPALADSWREDITMLRGLLSARQSKISTE